MTFTIEEKKIRAKVAQETYKIRLKQGNVNTKHLTDEEIREKALHKAHIKRQYYLKTRASRNELSEHDLEALKKTETLKRYENGYNNREQPKRTHSSKYNMIWNKPINESIEQLEQLEQVEQVEPINQVESIKDITHIVYTDAMSEIENIKLNRIDLNLSELSDSTIKKYLSYLNTIYSLYSNGNRPLNNFKWLDEISTISQIVDKKYPTLSTRQTVYAGLSVISESFNLLILSAYYKSASNKLMKKYLDERSENKLTPLQEEKFIDWIDFIKIGRIKNQTREEYLLYIFLTKSGIPPRRKQFYQSLVFIKSNNIPDVLPPNYVLIGDTNKVDKVVVNDYKTSDIYGSYVIKKFPLGFNKIVQGIITKINLCDYPKLFNNLTPYNTTYTLLRRSFITYWMKDNSNKKMATLKNMSKRLGHSINTFLSYRVI